jgi:uncharacterized protein YacL
MGLLAGSFVGAAAALLQRILMRLSGGKLTGGSLGLVVGLLVGRLSLGSFEALGELPVEARISLFFGVPLLLGCLGWTVGMRKWKEWNFPFLSVGREESFERSRLLLDTSVIIDGRIADICETNFLPRRLLIPQFVLRELQHIADSPDPLKRARGRRGLDILKRIQDHHDMEVEILDQDFPKIKEVDAKLVQLAKQLRASILTNDYNLNKVAQLNGIRVLNINELANALKPVVLPGEIMKVRIIKEGKEQGQGVGYLDDGTMVVVDNAKQYLGKSVDVAVTSVLQTTAGRMIFTVLKEDADSQAQGAQG